MHDAKAVRDDPAAYARGWASRGVGDAETVGRILEFEARLRERQTSLQFAQARRNEISKLIGAARAKKDEAATTELLSEVERLKLELPRLAEQERGTAGLLREELAILPNLPAPDVPEGEDEAGNVVQKTWGDPRVSPTGHARPWTRLNRPKDHVELGEALGMMDFGAAARMSGARFVVLKRDLARLERALGQFMLDLQTDEHGYTEIAPPLMVHETAMFGTGQLPKFEEDLFKATNIDWDMVGRVSHEAHLSATEERRARLDEAALDVAGGNFGRAREVAELARDLAADLPIEALEPWIDASLGDKYRAQHWLIPTAEVSLTNLVREQITPEEQLPLRLTALTPCFRSEAGSHGRDTRGMIRQHQFIKCELVSITAPEQSDDEHERMTTCAEAVLERLGLPYRRMLLCTGDMGFSARKTYDLEVWLPSQDRYREISSCSNCGDFQARRMDARTRRAGEKGTRLVHTLNGSGLAVGRTLVAILETYQDEGGRIAIPEALQPYMRGQTHIGDSA